MSEIKPEQIRQALEIIKLTAEIIKEAEEVPAGTLYALLMAKISLEGFESIIRTLCKTGLIEKRNNLLIWIGPKNQEVNIVA